LSHPLSELIELKANVHVSAFRLASLRLRELLRKANFNPNQPRVPRGYREGGQWTQDGAGTSSTPRQPELRTDKAGRPELPKERPAFSRYRYAYARQVAAWLLRQSLETQLALPIVIAESTHWIYENAPAIWSYLDRPKTLWELQRAARDGSKPGYEIHHIVEQDAARRAGFRPVLFDGPDNRVLIPAFRHREVTGWFMSRSDRFGGLSPREYLQDKSWEERKRVGLMALVEAGVLQP
jgi:hypothetical protein